jgi:RimJ/RimL family protein N-acetyltransferase
MQQLLSLACYPAIKRLIMPLTLHETHSIRKLWPCDRQGWSRHLRRLDAETRHLRFGTVVNDEFLEAYAETIGHPGSVVLGAFARGEIRASAELHPMPQGEARAAEVALTVEMPWQNHGLGSRLMDRLLTIAQNHGVARLFMVCLRDNRRMQHIAGKLGARLQIEADTVTGSLATPHPTMISRFDEQVADLQGLFSILLQWPPYPAMAMPGTQT